MAKKRTVIIEYRFDGPWREFTRTQVPAMIEHYKNEAAREYPGAKIRERDK
jgi:hypothetical protein